MPLSCGEPQTKSSLRHGGKTTRQRAARLGQTPSIVMVGHVKVPAPVTSDLTLI